MNRRQFLGTAAAATASRLAAQDAPQNAPQDAPDWGGNVLDVHLHPRQQPDGEWAHMQGCGVTHAVLLTQDAAEEHSKEAMAKRPGRFIRFVSVNPAREDAIQVLRNGVKGGA